MERHFRENAKRTKPTRKTLPRNEQRHKRRRRVARPKVAEPADGLPEGSPPCLTFARCRFPTPVFSFAVDSIGLREQLCIGAVVDCWQ